MTTRLPLVLLVDDDDIANFLHQRTIELTERVEEVVVVNDGQAALDLLTGANGDLVRRPDVIFLDINMPGMNGFDFLDAYTLLPSEARGRQLLVMLTTPLPPADSKTVEANGLIDTIITKPLTAELIHEVANQAGA